MGEKGMTFSCRIATGPVGEGSQEIREFKVVPRVGETIVIGGSTDNRVLRVTEVVHSFQPEDEVAEVILIVGPRTPA